MAATLLIHFGSPRRRDEIRPFIEDIFSDSFPLLAKPLSLFVLRGANKKYDEVGFAGAKETRELAQKLGDNYFLASQYGAPSIGEVLEEIEGKGHEQIKIVPLYVHATLKMYDLLVRKFLKLKEQYYRGLKFKWTGPFFDNPLFAEAWADSIREGLTGFKTPPHIIFSAHAVLEDDGEYKSQVEASAGLIMEKLGAKNRWSVAYQSRMRIGKWSRPPVEDEVRKLASGGVLSCLIVPVSFLFDNVETLSDIDRVIMPNALKAGIREIARPRMPGGSDKILRMIKEL